MPSGGTTTVDGIGRAGGGEVVGLLDEDAARHEVVQAGEHLPVTDRRHRDAQLGGQLQHLAGRVLQEP